MPDYPSFIGGSYTAQSPIADQERTINWYVESSQVPGASEKFVLYPTPGASELDDAGTGTLGRGHIAIGGREFCVIGTKLYEVDSSGGLTDRSGAVTLANDQYPATISSNGDGGGQLFITSGTNGYIYDLDLDTLGASIANIAGKASMGASIDGYFLALDSATSTLWISDLLDGTTWDPTQFIQRSIQPDPWVAVNVANRLIYLLGDQTSEIWYNAGTSPIPFVPHPSGLIEYGCAAPFSAEVVGSSLCWLSQTQNGSGSIVRADSFSVTTISTYAMQVAINGFVAIADAIGDSYEDLGHTFYNLTFPAAAATLSWDAETGIWHERGTWDATSATYDCWRLVHHAYSFGEHRALDLRGDSIYRMSSDVFTDVGGGIIRRLRRAPAMVHENKRLFYSSFELNVETGLAASGIDAQVMMRQSNDGGKTWGNERLRTAGELGQYSTRVKWNRCGSGRKRVFEVSVSAASAWRVLGAWLEVIPSGDV